MLKGEILAVGTELLLGQIVNTNAQFISKKCAEMGISVYYHSVVGDNPNRLEQALKVAMERSNLIILTGGLGPTKDDLTKETVASVLGRSLVMDEQALRYIENYFSRNGRTMTENNKKQALVLEGSHVFPNDTGMAPGMLVSENGVHVILLPGPPKEMEPMFTNYVQSALLQIAGKAMMIHSRVLRFFGIGEAQLETVLEDLIDRQTNPTIAPLASDGEVTLRLTAFADTREIAIPMLDEVEKEIQSRVGSYFYGYDDTNLFLELKKTLEAKGLTLACAESLTGGLFQGEYCQMPGASKTFVGGIVSYTNEVKEKLLGVSPETLRVHGAVSEQCAIEMAAGVLKATGSDVGLSFTGVAGPDLQEGKVPGTVFIGMASKDGSTDCVKLSLTGHRNIIRIRACKHGAHQLRTWLNQELV
ncbi:MAG TPA: competence/damage-inducible protein A [Bacillus sp. (in: firmicutes)]|uniref:competence/damage-inducible protein A n=1 Tax=Bacillus litorisediminis TaxID=2922713 RepID=UPI001FAC3F69|nr:competence/damage-inducible protein A [Bacillus litorisediminis]HWO78029.1 competence/damage-inducible protein A [Bacillus sp. (in: firmicutes)]